MKSHHHSFCICLLLIVLIIFFNNECLPQERTDSLKKALSTAASDTVKLYILNALVEEISEDSVWPLYNEEMGKLANMLIEKGEPLEKLKAQKFLGDYYNNLGYLQQQIGNAPSALSFYFNSLDLYEKTGDVKGAANALSNIGSIYHEQRDWDHAIQYYRRSLGMMKGASDTAGMALVLNNMGALYADQDKVINAVQSFEQCILLRTLTGDKEGLGITLTNIGSLYDKQGENEKALEYYRQSRKLQEETGDEVGLAYSQINFGHILMKQKKYAAAEIDFLQAKELALKSGSAAAMLGAANHLSMLYAAWGKFEPAYEMQVLFKQMTDSLRNDDSRRKILKKQMGYDFEKREALLKTEQEKKDVMAKEEIRRQKIIRNASIGSSLLIFTSGMIVLLFYKRKKEAEMEHKIMDSRMRAINSQMNPHFIFNCMHSIQNLVAKQELAMADSCLVRFANLIRKVLDNSSQKEITLEEDIETLKNYVELEKMRLDFPLDFQVRIGEDIPANEIMIPPLLLQPVIENAIIHGIKPKNAAGTIIVSIHKDKKILKIEVTDDGVGRPKIAVTVERRSYGIPLTRERLAYLGKSQKLRTSFEMEDIFIHDRPAGSRVSMFIPMQAM
jgi:tetratricopeptide (TPR) repeat protein